MDTPLQEKKIIKQETMGDEIKIIVVYTLSSKKKLT